MESSGPRTTTSSMASPHVTLAHGAPPMRPWPVPTMNVAVCKRKRGQHCARRAKPGRRCRGSSARSVHNTGTNERAYWERRTNERTPRNSSTPCTSTPTMSPSTTPSKLVRSSLRSASKRRSCGWKQRTSPIISQSRVSRVKPGKHGRCAGYRSTTWRPKVSWACSR